MVNDIGLVDPEDAARLLGLSVQRLAEMRSTGEGPAYIRITPRNIKYREEDLREWLAKRCFKSTSAYKPRRKRQPISAEAAA